MAIEGVPSEMTAVQVVEFKKPHQVRKVPTPQSLGPNDMLIKVAVASLCHTDNMVSNGVFPTRLPVTASHEGVGTVVAVGSEIKDFKKGDRAMPGLMVNECGNCYNCRGPDEWKPYCDHHEGILGVLNQDGAFAEYMLVDGRIACHLPEKVSFVDGAPLACAGITIYRAILESHVEKGGWLAIVGAGGGLGHLGIQMALAKGINVVAIDARDEALELCKKAGAKHIFDARQPREQLVAEIQKLTPDNLGCDGSINVSEHETAAGTACAVTKMHGRMVQVAQPTQVCIPFHELVFRDIRVVGTLIAGAKQSQDMLNLVADAGIQVETNVFHGLDKVPELIEFAHSGKMKGKAVVVVDEEQVKGEKK